MAPFFIVLFVVGIAWFVFYLHRRAALYYSFQGLAQRYHGRAFTTLGGSPGASFRYRDMVVRVTATLRLPRNGGRQTRLILDWPDRRFQCVVDGCKARAGNASRSGLSPFYSDQTAMENQFEIWTNDASGCQRLFSPACVWHLLQLKELSTSRQVFCCIRRGKFQLRIQGHFRRKQVLQDVVAKMLDFYSQMQLTQQHGLEFPDDQSPGVIEEMICPICSGIIGRDVVICVRCRAPHCKECWQYNGKCATFGCGAERFIAPISDRSR